MSRRRYTPGQIIWAKVPDRNGITKDRARPILVTITHPTNRKAPLTGLSISTDPTENPDDPVVEMPWDTKTGSTTGLYQWCAVVLLWPAHVPQDIIEDVTGKVSPDFLEMVNQKLQDARLWQLQRRRH